MQPFRIGVDYYPEQWSEERWDTDAALMRQAGFNTVRLAEFAWAKLEPALGQFDFAWLDRAIQTLVNHGLEVILGTPTASPPAWLMATDPSMFRVTADGRPVTYGHRRGYCPHHTSYQEHAKRIVAAMATHYANHPKLIGWQIDNEFGDRSYSSAAQNAFQNWLRNKYDSLEALNAAWGTVFWSHTYMAWSEIPLPLESGAAHNPGLALDFSRFSSDAYVAFGQDQIDIIRLACPQHFITHNLMGFAYDQLNYFDLAKNLDFVTWDNYPRMWWNIHEGDDSSRAALGHTTMRGLKNRNFWVMEQQAGAGGWQMVVSHPRPGELRLWAYQAIAHGADGIIFFRFRTARHGTEQYWHGLLEHDGTVGRRYTEAKQFGLELQRIGQEILGSKIVSKVAILQDYDSRFALQIQQNNPNLHYTAQISHWYSALHRRNISTDVIAAQNNLTAYKLVIAPLLHIVTPIIAANFESFVQNGGTLVLTARSAVKDYQNAVFNEALPGLLTTLAGVRVEEYDSLIGTTNNLNFQNTNIPIDIWCDILEPSTAEIIATYTQNHYAGRAAITRNKIGLGQVIYIGALEQGALPEALIPWLLESAGISSQTNPIEMTERWQGQQRLRFYLNHAQTVQTMALEQSSTSLISGEVHTNQLTLQPFAVDILV